MNFKLKENRLFKFMIAFSFLTVILLVLAAADKTITITGTGDDSFTISDFSDKEITDSSFSVEPDDSNAEVTFNGNNLGEAKDLTSIPLSLFEANNDISFSDDIDEFTLTYDYYRNDYTCPDYDDECPSGFSCYPNKKCYSSSSWCLNDNWCDSNEDCLNDKCCPEEYPLNITSPISESCRGSAIPVTPSNSPCTSVSSASIDFYLDNTLVRTGCNLSGDYGWELGTQKRCGIEIPSNFPIGTYQLRAVYTIDFHNYNQPIKQFTISATCGPTTPCQHSAGIDESSAVSIGGLIANEIYGPENGEYLVPKNQVVSIGGIGTFTVQCSNGVTWTGVDMPGVVTWTTNLQTSEQVTGDNKLFSQGACKIPDSYNRQSIFSGPSSLQGYLPPNCNIQMRKIYMGNSNTASVKNFTEAGSYSVLVDYINAECDAPDYICPYIQPGGTTSLCWIGTVNTRKRATGWEHFSDYVITVVNPQISVDYLSKTDGKNNQPTYYDYNITNTGIGKVNITLQLPSSAEFIISSAFPEINFVIDEGITTALKIGLLPKTSSPRIINSVVQYSYKNITLKDYLTYSYDGSHLIVNYSMPLTIIYDDDYSFVTQPPQVSQQALDFLFDFECSGNESYIVDLKDKIFYCTCKGRGFCIHDKTGDNKPCACIDEPEKDRVINGTEVEFNATRSFDDLTLPGNLFFDWYYDLKNESFYNGTGMPGAIFTRQFPIPGEYKVRLEVTDLSNLIGIDKSRFILNFELGPNCIEKDGSYYWVKDDEEIPSINDCFRPDGWPSTTCCPEENSCEYVGPAPTDYSCIGEPAPWACSDYNNEDDCDGFNIEVAKRSMEFFTSIGGFCDGAYIISEARDDDNDGELESCSRMVHDCRCVWNGSVCGQQASYSGWTCLGDITIENSENCTVIAILAAQREDECETTGYRTYGWQASWTGAEEDKPDWCVDNERKIRCPVKLTFFTIASLIAAVILIIVIYIWIKKRARKQKQIVKRKIRRKKREKR